MLSRVDWPWVGVGGGFALFCMPVLHSQPGLYLGRSGDFSLQPLPENTTVWGLGDVGEDSVSGNSFHGHRIGLHWGSWKYSWTIRSNVLKVQLMVLHNSFVDLANCCNLFLTWSYSKESSFWVYGPEFSILIEPHPSNIITNTGNFVVR